jgi:YD repeat-containing protein
LNGRDGRRDRLAAGVSAINTTTGVVNASLAEQEVIYRYDALGRPAVINHRDGTLERQSTFAYDSISGQLTSASSPEGTIQYAYDSADRLVRTFTAFTEVNYGYDSLGRLETVGTTKLNGTGHAASVVATYGYDAAGNKVSEVLGNGVSTTYTYDSLSPLTNLVTVLTGLQPLSQTYALRRSSRTDLLHAPRPEAGLTIARPGCREGDWACLPWVLAAGWRITR